MDPRRDQEELKGHVERHDAVRPNPRARGIRHGVYIYISIYIYTCTYIPTAPILWGLEYVNRTFNVIDFEAH